MRHLWLWGLFAGLLVLVVYLATAAFKRKKPELGAGINILACAIGTAGAVRLIVVVLTEKLEDMAAATPLAGQYVSLSAEDAGIIIMGAIALTWTCCQTICEKFGEL